jgi:DNA helicase-2/ATP-dependent DNA helicase PcrA
MVTSGLLSALNPQQREAVLHESGPLLVLAGAGSGKTRVLAYRVAHLIGERNVPPGRILAVTFTNKAANEMRDRIAGLVGEPIAKAVWIGTFHRICGRFLRRHGSRFVVYDEDDQRALVREVLRELNLDANRFAPQALLSAVSAAKNEGIDHAAFDRQATTYYERVVASVWGEYQKRLAERGALDFDDILLETLRLFDHSPEVLAQYQERFLHVLVDEYQDTNPVQFRITSRLSAFHRNLCAVGDADQAIYAWRGADVRNILEFERDFPDARIVKLEQNYRSTQTILKAAENLIGQNPQRYLKRLWTSRDSGDPVTLYIAFDEHDESRFVAERLRRLQDEGIPLRSCAVLYRINAMSRQFEDHFLRAGIPYQIVGGVRFYERREVRDLLAYLRAATNPRDVLSVRRIINVPRRGIGEVTLAKIEALSAVSGGSLLDAIRASRESRVESRECTKPSIRLSAQTGKAIGGFGALLDRIAEAAQTTRAASLIEQVIEWTGYGAALEAEGTDDARSRLENLSELVTVAQEFENTTGEASVEAFLDHLSLITDIDTYQEDSDRVTLMTLHAAKGLEFLVVFICGLEDGVFPHARTLDDPRQLEEERRLAYVGMTRAKERLFLTYTQQRTLFGRTSMNEPSRFLSEIPRDAVEELRTAHTAVSDWHPAAQAGDLPWREIPELAVGEHVRHKHFGVGRVVDVDGEGQHTVATVHFPRVGTKRLSLSYAPLERL